MRTFREFYRAASEGGGTVLRDAMREDRCFAVLVLFSCFSWLEDRVTKEAVQRFVSDHEKQCGRCWVNVRIRIAQMADGPGRRLYKQTLESFMLEFLAKVGCVHRIERTPEGLYYRTTFPRVMEGLPYELPYTAIEMFQPTDRNQRGHVLFDVRSAELFENPRSFIQHLDVTASREVKAFPAETGLLHWRTIINQGEGRLIIRWQSQTKELAPDWTLHGRYFPLVRKHAVGEHLREIDEAGNPNPTHSLGGEALVLRQMALNYDERSWFQGFLKVTLGQRNIDALRRIERDPMTRPTSLDETVLDSGGNVDRVRKPGAEEVDARCQETWRAKIAEQIDKIDQPGLLNRLRASLSDIELKVLDLKSQGLRDKAVGSRLGIRRETVSRHLRRIRAVAVGLRD